MRICDKDNLNFIGKQILSYPKHRGFKPRQFAILTLSFLTDQAKARY